jgi:hypothetical protein
MLVDVGSSPEKVNGILLASILKFWAPILLDITYFQYYWILPISHNITYTSQYYTILPNMAASKLILDITKVIPNWSWILPKWSWILLNIIWYYTILPIWPKLPILPILHKIGALIFINISQYYMSNITQYYISGI